MKYFLRTNLSSDPEGPFDLERARHRLRSSLRTEHGRGNAVHEGQRGIWLVSRGEEPLTELFWITDDRDAIVRLDDDAPGPASFLH